MNHLVEGEASSMKPKDSRQIAGYLQWLQEAVRGDSSGLYAEMLEELLYSSTGKIPVIDMEKFEKGTVEVDYVTGEVRLRALYPIMDRLYPPQQDEPINTVPCAPSFKICVDGVRLDVLWTLLDGGKINAEGECNSFEEVSDLEGLMRIFGDFADRKKIRLMSNGADVSIDIADPKRRVEIARKDFFPGRENIGEKVMYNCSIEARGAGGRVFEKIDYESLDGTPGSILVKRAGARVVLREFMIRALTWVVENGFEAMLYTKDGVHAALAWQDADNGSNAG